jgi:hypothetical protein
VRQRALAIVKLFALSVEHWRPTARPG